MATSTQSHQTTVNVSIQIVGGEHRRFPFRIDEGASLLELMQTGAHAGGGELLPSDQAPLDTLHNVGPGQEIGPAITDLEQSVGQFLAGEGTTKHFAITLVLAIRVNNRWKVAASASMTPREILALYELDFQQFTLYLPNSNDVLPLDTPIALTRGAAFEAQKDGKYGACHEGA